MAINDYITCCKCDVKLIYDGGKDNNRQWWIERWGREPEIMCPDCENKLEPVAWMEEMEPEPNVLKSLRMTSVREVAQEWKKPIPLYTAPPQRKPLTDEVIWLEYQRLWPFHPAEEPTLAKDIVKFARAIEAAHGIK